MKFDVSGEIKVGAQKRQFKKTLEAKSEKDAREKTYALFGSNNRLKRTAVQIKSVKKH